MTEAFKINTGTQQVEEIHASNKHSNFRVTEYNGVFEIQRKKINKITKGCLWWRKTTEIMSWEFVDKMGECLWSNGYVCNYDEKIESFTDLKSAFNRIDIMIEGIKYHYCL